MAICFLLVLGMLATVQALVTPTLVPTCQVMKGMTTSNITIPWDFSVRIETVAEESSRITNMRMFYSYSRNIIRLQSLDAGVRSDMYFYFQDNQILTYDYSIGRGSCTVDLDLAHAAETFIIGGSKDNKTMVPLTVLHLTGQSGFGSDISSIKITGNRVREMDVTSYVSCQRWLIGDMESIVNVTHHFSSKPWKRPGEPVVPVLIEMHGLARIHNQVRQVDHHYNFFDFQSYVSPSDFETPPGIMCLRSNAGMPFPNLPSYIKFSGEHVDPSNGQVVYFEVIYNADGDYVVIRTQAASNNVDKLGKDQVTVIRDYPSGLAYTIDETKFSCKTQNITEAAPSPFDFITPQGGIKEITPQQLFFAENAKFEYVGERVVRSMNTDTWVTKTNIPSFPNEEVTLEWYFAKPDVTSWNSGSDYYKKGNYRMPVLLKIWHNDNDTLSVDTNIYHVDFTQIMNGVINIRDCYPGTQSNYFQLIFKGALELVFNTNIDQFKVSTTYIIADIAGVRWLRIVDMKVYYDVSDAVIEFELLDAPPYANDISGTPFQPIGLQQATQRINDAVANGKMIIKVWDSATNQISKPLTAYYNGKSAVQSTAPPDDSGYSSGSMAGLGIAMVIIGGAGGGVGAHFFFK